MVNTDHQQLELDLDQDTELTASEEFKRWLVSIDPDHHATTDGGVVTS